MSNYTFEQWIEDQDPDEVACSNESSLRRAYQADREPPEFSGKPSLDELNQWIESTENDPDNLAADV